MHPRRRTPATKAGEKHALDPGRGDEAGSCSADAAGGRGRRLPAGRPAAGALAGGRHGDGWHGGGRHGGGRRQ
ncbi:hypothetical protein DEW08_14600 [Azospirillum thermophilum]|uniref:Uncharacterized protein n=1 Tax=Azospirillum thermophilum TaxID=2202148 RepID=A0A2S2CS02_9PROT|nr:hypothetical protein DEW08_14600 [Azospirillum thermophilum]